MTLLGACLIGLGNRGYGTSSALKLPGVILMSLGLIIGLSVPLWGLPVVVLLAWFFRLFSSRPWLHMTNPEKIAWIPALLRTTAILPLALFLCYLTISTVPIVLGIVAIPLIPTIYWVCGKVRPTQPIELAEILTGIVIGLN